MALIKMSKNKGSIGVYDTILNRRSIRRFLQKEIPIEILKKFVNAARLAPSAANLQPLEYFISNEKKLCSEIFETLSWAGYIKPKWTPAEDERPTAYIIPIVTYPENRWYERDVSFASENIVLAAEEEGIGSCVICKINKIRLNKILDAPENVIIDSVIALGYKNETSVVEDFIDSVEYWRDEKEVLHVPKRKLDDIIHINKF
jgi:nitroreductase